MPPDLRTFSLLNRSRRRSYLPPVATYPSIGWLLVGLLIPVSVFFLFSFWETGVFTLIRTWSLDQYREVVTDDLYYGLILRTLLLGLTVSAVVLPVAYLGAYVLRFIISRGRRIIFFLIVASALASYLVRIYAWKAILTPAGILNSALDSLGLISEPLTLLGRPGVIIALTHILVPIAMLPIAGAMESVNPDLIRASRDLGAGPVETFLRVTLPLTARGVLTAFVLTFVLAVGDYVTPQLVGGKGSLMIGRVIFDQFGITGNYALASALSFSLIVAAAAFIVGVILCVRVLTEGSAPPRRIRHGRPRSSSAAERGRCGSGGCPGGTPTCSCSCCSFGCRWSSFCSSRSINCRSPHCRSPVGPSTGTGRSSPTRRSAMGSGRASRWPAWSSPSDWRSDSRPHSL